MKIFRSVGWSIQKKGPDGPEMIQEDGGISEQATQLLRQAVESQNKLLKDGQVLLKGGKIKEGPTVVALKKGCASATQMANQLLTIIDFGIMPDGRDVCKTELEKFLKSVAMATAEFNALIETTKGKIRSQSN